MGNSAKRDSDAAKRAETQRIALELRLAGASYEAIAQQTGYTHKSAARKAVQRAIKSVIKEPAEEVRDLELSRLDAMLLGVWKKATSGDPAAIDRALRIMERRAAYLGIDAPKSVHVDMSKMTNEQLRQIFGGDPPAASQAGAAGAAATDGEGKPSDE